MAAKTPNQSIVGSMDDFEVVTEQPQPSHGHSDTHLTCASRLMAYDSLRPQMPWALQRLVAVDQLIIKQKVELLEAFTGCETTTSMRFSTQGVRVFRYSGLRSRMIDANSFAAALIGLLRCPS